MEILYLNIQKDARAKSGDGQSYGYGPAAGIRIVSIHTQETKSGMSAMVSEALTRIMPRLVTKCLKLMRKRRPLSPTYFHFTVIRRTKL